jgi:hypothetical protein
VAPAVDESEGTGDVQNSYCISSDATELARMQIAYVIGPGKWRVDYHGICTSSTYLTTRFRSTPPLAVDQCLGSGLNGEIGQKLLKSTNAEIVALAMSLRFAVLMAIRGVEE